MHDAGIGYGSINHPVDRDPVCGYVGVIGEVCPRCGRREGEPSARSADELRKLYPEITTFCGWAENKKTPARLRREKLGGIIMTLKTNYEAKYGKGVGFERIRRITGYLVGTMDKWNDAKKAEEHDRVKHGLVK